ncbi:MAG: hypothetical protein MJ171_08550 [Clostridia bacterium]|nr:hypothetical protein [Clostridia bacterium]
MKENPKFSYGYDVDVYIEKAVEVFRNEYHYHWADRSLFSSQERYAIEKIDDEYHYVRYVTFAPDNTEREILDEDAWSPYRNVQNGDDFIRRIVSDNAYMMLACNTKVACLKIPFENGLELDGWYLERYEFNRLKTGDYSVYVQAGDRVTGGGRDFFIPPSYLEGTFEEFIEKYEKLVPGKDFGLYGKDLINNTALKEFLGFRQ